ncbi:Rrf2 family transcriptional regulator [Alteromonas sp. 5E99-2]|uniref:RrF2 family transcriptional regulator n=1 Tax=Alteromonas sp. 5E99-2 TaxID=2817683 RepID=UPI001A9965AF|nr:Rrf2 family transcriptional regulator [Alteromonas sp. 5E99-2]MBO1255954.1 Rrf2 family transcriptional regulator [Alteromonas sp. 5E99-2]
MTKQTDFALRTLIYLAKQDSGKRVLVQEISTAYAIPLNHLTKIVNKLSQLGYIKSYRGRHGGVELGKDAFDICIRQVIEDFEPSLSPADCDNCVLDGTCDLKGHLELANQAFLNALGSKSLADMV